MANCFKLIILVFTCCMFSGGDLQQSCGQKSPAQSQGIEHDSEHGNITDTDDSDEDPLPTSKTNAYTSQKRYYCYLYSQVSLLNLFE